MAEFAVAEEHWIAAEPLLQQVLERVPSHASAHHLLGKVLLAKGELEAALAEQRLSAELDPRLGWNWFAAGELLLELDRWEEAVQAFEHAQAALPAESWMGNQLSAARWLQECHGERLSDGVGPHTYKYWVKHYEPRLPPERTALNAPFWCLEPTVHDQQRWYAFHSSATLQPTPCLGQSPWPTGGWLVLLGAGATLRPGALQKVESWLAGDSLENKVSQELSQSSPLRQSMLNQPDLIYSDEDRLDKSGQRSDPWFKPGWVEESFWSSPWLGAFSLWRISWLRDRKLPIPPADPEGRWNWQLMALDYRPRVSHLPLVLVSTEFRQHLSPEPLRNYLLRRGEHVRLVRPHSELPGCFQLQWELPQRWKCSVVIPTKDNSPLLKQCLESLWITTEDARRNGLDLEILIVDNGSVEKSTQLLLKKWRSRIRVLRCDETFNWSRLNNLSAMHASGELLLLLNNDIEAIDPGWIEGMAAQAFRPAVGAVGAILTYPDGTIQHGGVVVGMRSRTDHAYRGLPLHHNVHRARSRLLTSWGAVTGACLMIRRELLERLGGFDEGLPVEFSDIELCLRLSQLGYRCVIPPEALLIHYESQSRDPNNSITEPHALLRMKGRWKTRLSTSEPWWPMQSERNCPDGRPRGLENLKA